MTTISVSLSASLVKFIDEMVRQGNAANRADVVRKALAKMSEYEAIEAVRRSMCEARAGKILKGDLRELVKNFR